MDKKRLTEKDFVEMTNPLKVKSAFKRIMDKLTEIEKRLTAVENTIKERYKRY